MTRTEYEIKTQNLHKEVYRLSKAGYNKQEIADATGYSKGYVERILYAMNGPAERRTLSETDKERIIKLRGEGKTIKEISAEIGFSMSAVQKCLKEEVPCKFTMATRKPQASVTYINGKRYKDVSEFYLGV